MLLELMELAVTWPELEYSETHTIPPRSWMAFVESHHWGDRDRVERIFSVATDIVMTARRASQRRLESSDHPPVQHQAAELGHVAAALAGEACHWSSHTIGD